LGSACSTVSPRRVPAELPWRASLYPAPRRRPPPFLTPTPHSWPPPPRRAARLQPRSRGRSCAQLCEPATALSRPATPSTRATVCSPPTRSGRALPRRLKLARVEAALLRLDPVRLLIDIRHMFSTASENRQNALHLLGPVARRSHALQFPAYSFQYFRSAANYFGNHTARGCSKPQNTSAREKSPVSLPNLSPALLLEINRGSKTARQHCEGREAREPSSVPKLLPEQHTSEEAR
jgi:hypothetical protein